MKISLEDFVILKKNLKPNTEIKILTESMEPLFYKHDKIKISPVLSEKDINISDPVVYWHNNKLICHFVYKIEKNSELIFITKGINNKEYDPSVKFQQILGIVTEPKIPLWKKVIFKCYLTILSKLSR